VTLNRSSATDNQSNNVAAEDKIQREVEIPRGMIGLVIGTKGATLKDIKNESRTVINIQRKNSMAVIEGTRKEVEAAEELIETLIKYRPKGARGPNQEETTILRLLVPADKCGKVIGKQGKNVKAVTEATGASVNILEKALNVGPYERCCLLRGPKSGVFKAKQMIEETLGMTLTGKQALPVLKEEGKNFNTK
jgi:polyribonucleotide nucleotidyltransferase